MSKKYDVCFHVTFFGYTGVGKKTLIMRYLDNPFVNFNLSTTGNYIIY